MSNVYWISGGIAERKLALENLKSQFSDNIFHIDKERNLSDLDELIYQEGCFSDKRLIIISELPESTLTKASVVNNVKKLIENIPSNCYIVFNNISGEGTKPLLTHVAKVGGKVHEFDTVLDKHNAFLWVVQQFSQLNKNIEEDVARKFVELNGFDAENNGIGIDVLLIGIKKIAIFAGKRKNIELQDVLINSFPSFETVIWSIFDAFDNKNISECHKAFNDFIGKEDNVKSSVIQVLNVSLWRFRLFVFLKELLSQNKNKAQVLQEALSLLKIQTKGENFQMISGAEKDQNDKFKTAYTEFYINKELNSNYGNASTLEKYSRKDLIKIINCIYKGINNVRFCKNDSQCYLIMDALISTVCNALNDKVIDKMFFSIDED